MESSIARRGGARAPGSMFGEAQADYLAENFLGRLATVSKLGQPHVVPVAYRFDGSSIIFGGWNLKDSRKFKDILLNPKVAFVVDDVVSTTPWAARGVEVRGCAEVERAEGDAEVVRIRPRAVRSWGMGRGY